MQLLSICYVFPSQPKTSFYEFWYRERLDFGDTQAKIYWKNKTRKIEGKTDIVLEEPYYFLNQGYENPY